MDFETPHDSHDSFTAVAAPTTVSGKPCPARVLYVSNVSAVGGAEHSLLNLVQTLDRSRFQVFAVVPSPGALASELLRCDVNVSFCRALGRLRRSYRPASLVRTARQLTASSKQIQDLALRLRANLIHANSASAALHVLSFPWRRTCPVVWHHRDLRGGVELHWLLRYGDGVVAVSEACRRMLPSNRVARAIVIPSGVTATIRARKLSVPPRLVSVANASPWKNHDLLLDTARILHATGQEFEWVIAGGDPFGEWPGVVERLRARVEATGLGHRVRVVGPIADAASLLSGAASLVHAAFPEPFGRVVVEAMAVGCPVIAFAGDHGPGEILADGVGGVLVAPRTAAALAHTISSLLAHSSLMESLAHGAIEKFTRAYDGRIVANMMASFYDTLI